MKKPMQVYLTEELIEALGVEAKRQSRSRNSMIEFILKEYGERKSVKIPSLQEQLREGCA